MNHTLYWDGFEKFFTVEIPASKRVLENETRETQKQEKRVSFLQNYSLKQHVHITYKNKDLVPSGTSQLKLKNLVLLGNFSQFWDLWEIEPKNTKT